MPSPRRRLKRWSTWVILGLGVLASVFAGLQVKQGITHDAAKEFAFECDHIVLKVQERLSAYALILRGGAGLFAASNTVARAEWRAYVATLRASGSVPGVQGFGFAQVIPPEDLAAHVAGIRSEGFPEYSVRPPGERTLYSAIIYLEPFRDRNLRAFGYDMYAEPVRHAAMDQARDTGEAALSGKVELVQETATQVQAGTLMYVPVYRNGAALETRGQRQAALIGWVYSPYRMNDLMTGILGDWESREGKVVDLTIYDGREVSPAELLFDSKPDSTPALHSPFYQQRTLDFNGRHWLLVFDRTATAPAIRYAPAWLTLVGGLALSGLLFWLMRTLINTRVNAVRIADGLTAEIRRSQECLRKSQEDLQLLLNSTAEAIYGIDLNGNCTFCNSACLQFLGYPHPDALLGQNMHWLIHPKHADGTVFPVEECRIFQAFKTGERMHVDDEVLWRCDGTAFPAEYWSYPQINDGAVVGAVVTFLDITARKRMEETIIQSRDLLQTVIDTAPIRVFWKDRDLHYLGCNLAFARDAGMTHAGEVIGKDDYRMGWPAQAEQYRADDLAVIVSGRAKLAYDEPQTTPDGQTIWLRTSKVPLRNQDHEVFGLLGIYEDITQHKQAEAQLRALAERLQVATEAAGIGVWEWDIVNKRLWWDERMYALYGVRETDFSSADVAWVQGLHPEDAAQVQADIVHALRGDQHFSPEFRIRWPDGTVRYLAAFGKALKNVTGAAQHMIGVVWDITAQRQAALALAASEAKARAIVDASPVPFAIAHETGTVSYLNAAFVSTFGYTLADLPTWTDWQLKVDPVDRPGRQEHLDPLQPNGAPFAPIEANVRCKDGRIRTVMARTTPLSGADRLNTFYDITDLKQAREQAEQAARIKADFLAHMSHEIRTPLNVVLGLAQVLNREPLAANQRDMVASIRSAGQSLLVILNDVLDLSKIEADQLRIEPRPFDLGVLLAKLDSLMGQTAQARGLTLRIEPPDPPLGPLVGDELRLEQVLFNLLGNAIKFTERGGVTLRVAVRETAETTRRLRFAVHDTGIGIAPADLARLFTPFTQADTGIGRRFGGTGLGLSICKRLVALMGGESGADSQPGEGSTFWFELPFVPATGSAAQTLATVPLPLPAGPRLAGLHFLVVDDSAMNRDLVERALALEGATATLAPDGQQALEHLQAWQAPFDAVLMDVRMPVMDGLTATRLIRSRLGLTDLPVIALTAGVLADEQEAVYAAGMNDILPKPLDLEQMAVLLSKWVKPRPAADGQPTPTAADPDSAGTFPDIAGIDRAYAAQSLRHNRTWFLHLLGGLVDEFVDAEELTRGDLIRGDRETAARRMHTLRGNAGSLGALELMAAAAGVETAITQGATHLDEQLASLGRQLAILIAASAPWRSDAASAAPAAEPTLPLAAERLDELRTILLRHDLIALQRFDELVPGLLGILGEAGTVALGHAIRGLRFDEALAVLAVCPGERDHDTAQEAEDAVQSAWRILIVDDNPMAIKVLHKALEGLGELRFATDGQDALTLLAKYPVDLVLLDATMPGMDGFATCRALQQDYPDIPVVFVTAASDFATEVRALDTGANDFISKPINPPVVRARAGLHLKLKAQNDLLRTLSSRDPLTGVANRRVLDERLTQEWRRALRHRQPVSLLMIDIDHFKSYNDHYGHLQGDDCLRRVAETLAATATRSGDLVARYGGEEFAVLLGGSHPEAAVALAEKIGAAVRALAIPHAHSTAAPYVTVSIGAAGGLPLLPPQDQDAPASPPPTPAGESGLLLARELLEHADRALYAAKAAGRDRVCMDGADEH